MKFSTSYYTVTLHSEPLAVTISFYVVASDINYAIDSAEERFSTLLGFEKRYQFTIIKIVKEIKESE